MMKKAMAVLAGLAAMLVGLFLSFRGKSASGKAPKRPSLRDVSFTPEQAKPLDAYEDQKQEPIKDKKTLIDSINARHGE